MRTDRLKDTHTHDEANRSLFMILTKRPKTLANKSVCLQPDLNTESVNVYSIS
jgi:hypothetical protein